MSGELGVTVVIVEQRIAEVLRYAERALVMERGAAVHEAVAHALLEDNVTLERYVGVAVH